MQGPVRLHFARRLAAITCLCMAVLAQAADAPSERAFTDEYVAALRAAQPTFKVKVVKPLEVLVTMADGKTSTAYLDNAFQAVQRDPASKAEVIARHVGLMADLTDLDTAIEVKNIVPVIKDRAWVSETQASRQARTSGVPFKYVYDDFNQELVIVYAEDKPTQTNYFDAASLAKAGVDRKALKSLALANLLRILPELKREEIDGVSMLTAGGDYDASLLLVDEIWSGDMLKVEGEIVVAVPARNVLLFVPASDQARVDELKALVRRVFAEYSYTLTDQLFVFRKGKFQRYSR